MSRPLSGKALVLTLMQYGPPGGLDGPSQGHHHRAVWSGILKLHGVPVIDGVPVIGGTRRASRGLDGAPVGPEVSILGTWVPLQIKIRRQKAVQSTTATGLAVGMSEDGQREILGLRMAFGETEEGWRRFICGLKKRGLSGVELATSDAHGGLKQALEESFPGLIWQRDAIPRDSSMYTSGGAP